MSTPLLSNSTSAISIARDTVKHELTKHITVKHELRSRMMLSCFDMCLHRPQLQLADFFTKEHSQTQYRFFLLKLSVIDPP
jgi:hypothetical protein